MLLTVLLMLALFGGIIMVLAATQKLEPVQRAIAALFAGKTCRAYRNTGNVRFSDGGVHFDVRPDDVFDNVRELNWRSAMSELGRPTRAEVRGPRQRSRSRTIFEDSNEEFSFRLDAMRGGRKAYLQN